MSIVLTVLERGLSLCCLLSRKGLFDPDLLDSGIPSCLAHSSHVSEITVSAVPIALCFQAQMCAGEGIPEDGLRLFKKDLVLCLVAQPIYVRIFSRYLKAHDSVVSYGHRGRV